MPQDDEIERIYREFGHVVLRRARQILGSNDEAVDVMQEIFTSLLTRPEQFSGRSQVTTWLYSATTHLCLNRIRNRKTRQRVLTDQVAPGIRVEDEPRAEDIAAVRQLLALMPDDLARVVVFYHMDEMTHDEIARVLGCSSSHVGNLLERACAFARKVSDP
jgi:RNA polymerase sigma-70 factor (ECF subfamily)